MVDKVADFTGAPTGGKDGMLRNLANGLKSKRFAGLQQTKLVKVRTNSREAYQEHRDRNAFESG